LGGFGGVGLLAFVFVRHSGGDCGLLDWEVDGGCLRWGGFFFGSELFFGRLKCGERYCTSGGPIRMGDWDMSCLRDRSTSVHDRSTFSV
jgi:hypothetical protein